MHIHDNRQNIASCCPDSRLHYHCGAPFKNIRGHEKRSRGNATAPTTRQHRHTLNHMPFKWEPVTVASQSANSCGSERQQLERTRQPIRQRKCTGVCFCDTASPIKMMRVVIPPKLTALIRWQNMEADRCGTAITLRLMVEPHILPKAIFNWPIDERKGPRLQIPLDSLHNGMTPVRKRGRASVHGNCWNGQTLMPREIVPTRQRNRAPQSTSFVSHDVKCALNRSYRRSPDIQIKPRLGGTSAAKIRKIGQKGELIIAEIVIFRPLYFQVKHISRIAVVCRQR
mmetsp:Transcript_21316/g.48512  ORF Transcript_21316/g.48512 Transcript_21316/m.48512 type:complete len:284 (+) Transcript_21316:353-1204(+)